MSLGAQSTNPSVSPAVTPTHNGQIAGVVIDSLNGRYVSGALLRIDPGSFVAAPVYAPALVAFLTDPASLLFTAATAPLVGWFPLGPREVFWPSFTNDQGFIRAINAGIVSDRM